MDQNDVLYDVLFTGKLLDDTTTQQASQSIAALFKTTPDKIAHLFNGNTHILKKKLSKQDALKYKTVLRKAGLSILFKVHDDKANTNKSQTSTTAAPTTVKSSQDQPLVANVAQPTSSATNHPSPKLSLAPTGADVLTEAERKDFTPANIDTSSIQLTSPFLEPETTHQPAPPAPDTSHINIAALGADLLESSAQPPEPLNLNLDDITLAPPGSQLEELKEDIPELNPDTSGISIAPVGADILAEKKERPAVASPDISHISLED